MQLKGPKTYHVRIGDKKGDDKRKKIVSVHNCRGKETRFSTKEGELKLYVVSSKNKPLYVGGTKQPFRRRLYYGLTAKGENGYSGYLWRDDLKEVTIRIWNISFKKEDFEKMKDDPSIIRAGKDKKRRKDILLETVESEVVLLIQQEFKQWPKYQSEIHFHQSNDAHKEAAQKIVSHYLGATCPTA